MTLFIAFPPQTVPSAFPSPLCSSAGETRNFIWRLDFSYSFHVCLQNPFGKEETYSLGLLSLKVIGCRKKKRKKQNQPSQFIEKTTKV